MKDWPNQDAIKKLFRTAVANFIFGYTRMPFRPFWSLTAVKWSDIWLECPWANWSRQQNLLVPSAIPISTVSAKRAGQNCKSGIFQKF